MGSCHTPYTCFPAVWGWSNKAGLVSTWSMDLLSLSEALDSADCSTSEGKELLASLLRNAYLLYHSHVSALQVFGRKCLQGGLYPQAEFFFSRALQVAPSHPSVKEDLRNLHDTVVPRWHFLMLNDKERNSSYFRAILSAVRSIPDCSVLDVGSGTGILR